MAGIFSGIFAARYAARRVRAARRGLRPYARNRVGASKRRVTRSAARRWVGR